MVLDYFRKISAVPRGSENNKAISDYLVGFAKDNNLRYIQDEALNVVIFKDATPGYENCEPLIFQGHMDMVCEKIPESNHDFRKDGITIIEEDGYLRADGTTLGGDDGIAVAYMLEYLSDDALIHPPLEMVITTDEEIGMCGAIQFDAGVLKGRRMINIDSEEEGIFTVSCAGGLVGEIGYDVVREEYSGIKADIRLAGLKGGHSGIEINKNRWNSVITMGRLSGMLPSDTFRILSLNGGKKDNVIPNEACMSIVISGDGINKAADIICKAVKVIIDEMTAAEPEVYFEIIIDGNATIIDGSKEDKVKDISGHIKNTVIDKYMVLDCDTHNKLNALLTYVPNGVQVMSACIEGMVESSCNMGIFEISENRIKAVVSMRSSKESYIEYMSNRLRGLASIIGGSYDTYGSYPGWDMKPESAFRDMMCEVYSDTFGKEAIVEGVHAGLEGGLFVRKVPDMDIVSIGPNMYNIHTSKEKIEIASVERVDRFLRNFIEKYAKQMVMV